MELRLTVDKEDRLVVRKQLLKPIGGVLGLIRVRHKPSPHPCGVVMIHISVHLHVEIGGVVIVMVHVKIHLPVHINGSVHLTIPIECCPSRIRHLHHGNLLKIILLLLVLLMLLE